jgi:acyl-coenzyme A synthetase/AMP-(fatty) acid ligase
MAVMRLRLKFSMKSFYNMDPGDVFWAASDIGWTVGHSYTIYGPLLHGCTTIMYEGKPVRTPDAGSYWRVIRTTQSKSFVHGTYGDSCYKERRS